MRLAVLFLFTLLAPLSLAAQDKPFAKRIEYSADMTYEVAGMKGGGKVYQGKNADRREMTMQGQQSVIIVKGDEVLMLMPAMNMAMRMPLGSDPLSDALDPDPDAEFQPLGKETINGEKTTKYKINYEGGSGLFWTTNDGIIMKVEAETGEGKLIVNTSNVKRGAQPTSLFELPDGVQIMDMQGFGQIGAKGELPARPTYQ